ncbi:MAG: hypothetical protein SGBAC_002304 [Bacillariaceae sp.]
MKAVTSRVRQLSQSRRRLINLRQASTAFDSKEVYSKAEINEREPVRPHPLSATKRVPGNIVRPPYADTGEVPYSLFPNRILLHDAASVKKMSRAARLARQVLDYACTLAKPGVTTDEIDIAVHEEIIRRSAYPSPLNYHGFPKSLCSSINEVICHGIPDSRPLEFGDIVSFDVSCFIGGVHGDNCATVIVGDEQDKDEIGVDWRGVPYLSTFDKPEDEEMMRSGRRLVHAARESLYAAIEECGPGKCLTSIGGAIQDVSDSYGYSTVTKYRGHGISSEFHTAPYVKHYRNNDTLELQPGMIFTIEPMIVEDAGDCFEWDDQWTVATTDGGAAAQFEHTVHITQDGVEILTLPE